MATHTWFVQVCLLCVPYLLKVKEQYIVYYWVCVALSSNFWAVLNLEHRFITSLLLCFGFNAIFTYVDHFIKYVYMTPGFVGRVHLVPYSMPSSFLTRLCSFLVFFAKLLMMGTPSLPATFGQSCSALWALLCNSVQPITSK